MLTYGPLTRFISSSMVRDVVCGFHQSLRIRFYCTIRPERALAIGAQSGCETGSSCIAGSLASSMARRVSNFSNNVVACLAEKVGRIFSSLTMLAIITQSFMKNGAKITNTIFGWIFSRRIAQNSTPLNESGNSRVDSVYTIDIFLNWLWWSNQLNLRLTNGVKIILNFVNYAQSVKTSCIDFMRKK